MIIPVLSLAEALARQPDARLFLYNRKSSYRQAGKGKVKLTAMTNALADEIRRQFPDPRIVCRLHQGVEKGQLHVKRRMLLRAIRIASNYQQPDRPVILVASDLSRFIRSATYDRWRNPEAFPTTEEFACLREMANGLTLATLADPALTEPERLSLAMRRSGTCGRPSTMTHSQALSILDDLGIASERENGTCVWEESLATVARRYRVTKAAVQRLLEREVPGQEGKRLKDFAYPGRVFRLTFCPKARSGQIVPKR